ncbi:MAG: PIN domain-containing protein [Haloechinothrix sp.]
MPTRVYVDTSEVAKLFIAGQETTELRKWLGELSDPRLVSSALLAVELLRLLRLVNPATLASAEQFLSTDVDIVEITPPVLDDAATVPPTRLRTLDAIHLPGLRLDYHFQTGDPDVDTTAVNVRALRTQAEDLSATAARRRLARSGRRPCPGRPSDRTPLPRINHGGGGRGSRGRRHRLIGQTP